MNNLTEGKRVKTRDLGVFIGNTKALGYVRNEKKDGALKEGKLLLTTIKNTKDITALQGYEVVQFIFMAYLCNLSLHQIANELNKQFGLTRRGTGWMHKSVRCIVKGC